MSNIYLNKNNESTIFLISKAPKGVSFMKDSKTYIADFHIIKSILLVNKKNRRI